MNCGGKEGGAQLRRPRASLVQSIGLLQPALSSGVRVCFGGTVTNQRTEVSPFCHPLSTFPGPAQLCDGVLEPLNLSESPALTDICLHTPSERGSCAPGPVCVSSR